MVRDEVEPESDEGQCPRGASPAGAEPVRPAVGPPDRRTGGSRGLRIGGRAGATGETAVPSGSATPTELPHWTEPPTGQVPAVLSRDTGDEPGNPANRGADLARGGCRLGGARRGVRARHVRQRRGGPGLARRDRRHRTRATPLGVRSRLDVTADRADPQDRPPSRRRHDPPPNPSRSRPSRRVQVQVPKRRPGEAAPEGAAEPGDAPEPTTVIPVVASAAAAAAAATETRSRGGPHRPGSRPTRRLTTSWWASRSPPARPVSDAPGGPDCCRPGCGRSARRTSRCRSTRRWPRSRRGRR